MLLPPLPILSLLNSLGDRDLGKEANPTLSVLPLAHTKPTIIWAASRQWGWPVRVMDLKEEKGQEPKTRAPATREILQGRRDNGWFPWKASICRPFSATKLYLTAQGEDWTLTGSQESLRRRPTSFLWEAPQMICHKLSHLCGMSPHELGKAVSLTPSSVLVCNCD